MMPKNTFTRGGPKIYRKLYEMWTFNDVPGLMTRFPERKPFVLHRNDNSIKESHAFAGEGRSCTAWTSNSTSGRCKQGLGIPLKGGQTGKHTTSQCPVCAILVPPRYINCTFINKFLYMYIYVYTVYTYIHVYIMSLSHLHFWFKYAMFSGQMDFKSFVSFQDVDLVKVEWRSQEVFFREMR